MPIIKCDKCGKKFKRILSHIREVKHNFCSRECFARWKGQTVICICKYCGKNFKKYESATKQGQGIFCSRKCRGRWQSKYIRGKNHLGYKEKAHVKRICKICGKEFTIKRKQLKQPGGGSYCSMKCLGEARRRNFLKNNPMHNPTSYNKLMKTMQTKEYKEKQIRNTLKGLLKRPTSLERKFIEIIKQNNLPFRYVGDGAFLIGYKNPDFIHNNEQKICIEVRGDYWYSEDWAKERINHFAKYGWKCIIFKGSDLEKLNFDTSLFS